MRLAIPHPPPINDIGLKREVRLRFLCNAAFANSITYQNLLDILNVGATAATAYDLFYAVKVKRVEVWANGLTNAVATVTVIFDGAVAGAVGDQKIHTDSSMGIEPAHVVARPTRLSQAAQFQVSSSTPCFDLVCPSGSIVDLELSLRQPLLGVAVAVQNAPAAVVAGVLYQRGLDGLAVATSKFTPVGPAAVD